MGTLTSPRLLLEGVKENVALEAGFRAILAADSTEDSANDDRDDTAELGGRRASTQGGRRHLHRRSEAGMHAGHRAHTVAMPNLKGKVAQ